VVVRRRGDGRGGAVDGGRTKFVRRLMVRRLMNIEKCNYGKFVGLEMCINNTVMAQQNMTHYE
jgi:hypothetical protein